MVKPRVVETDEGIQGEDIITIYDAMQRRLRDKGWIETDSIINYGLSSGLALEIGCGPAYLGLEWLTKTSDTELLCVEISKDMIQLARKNAAEYELVSRIGFRQGRAEEIPFDDNFFDCVFSNGSLHEWTHPIKAFNEIHRVLKKGGKYYISDLKRNMNLLVQWFLKVNTKPREIIPGLVSSINAAYTKKELEGMLDKSLLKNVTVDENPIGIEIKGWK